MSPRSRLPTQRSPTAVQNPGRIGLTPTQSLPPPQPGAVSFRNAAGAEFLGVDMHVMWKNDVPILLLELQHDCRKMLLPVNAIAVLWQCSEYCRADR